MPTSPTPSEGSVPAIQDSRLCGTCHLNQEKFLSIATYDDWRQASDRGTTTGTCQSCHMTMHPGEVELAVGGPPRSGVRAHTFIEARDPELLARTLDLGGDHPDRGG